MTEYIWKEEYSIGIEKLDREHQHIMGIINELKRAIDEKKTKELTSVILSELILYMNYHFKTEELYIELYDKEHLAAHKIGHRNLRRRLAQMQKDQKAGKDVSRELARLLTANFEKHMKDNDRQLATQILQNA